MPCALARVCYPRKVSALMVSGETSLRCAPWAALPRVLFGIDKTGFLFTCVSEQIPGVHTAMFFAVKRRGLPFHPVGFGMSNRVFALIQGVSLRVRKLKPMGGESWGVMSGHDHWGHVSLPFFLVFSEIQSHCPHVPGIKSGL